MSQFQNKSIDDLCINTIRTLSIDAIQKANSGHPGAPMSLAPLAYVLWTKFMRHNPANPLWFNRDRFVLSNGHASMLLYSMLHLSGYDLSLDDIKNFRQWKSKTPGHPEYRHTPGAETTTGPLGQGMMNAVGMAMAEAHLGAVYNRPDFDLILHFTYVFCGDGDFMEGASHEAASLAGHLGLGRLIAFYDDNHISIEGDTNLAYSDNVQKRFEAYNWHVINVGDHANDLSVISQAIEDAQKSDDRPTLIIVRTHIGYGSPNLQDTATAHGAPLGDAEIKLTKRAYGWPEDEKFMIPDNVYAHMRETKSRGGNYEKEWLAMFGAYSEAHPESARKLNAAISGELPADWDENLPTFSTGDAPAATRQTSGKIINAIANSLPSLFGGSADLGPSTNTLIKSSPYFSRENYTGRNVAWGVREHVMAAAANGIALHGGLRPYTATFFVFTDYARPAIRLAALMGLPVIHVMTHDSIGLGEDGPTHQPVEHLAALRVIPNLNIIRPADANETVAAWRAALQTRDKTTILVLSRQKTPVLPQTDVKATGLLRGAYILSAGKSEKPDVILMASGTEVRLILAAAEKLAAEGVSARCVSFPSWELFEAQSAEYQTEILPEEVTARVSIEAGSPMGWSRWVGAKGETIGISGFGASAPAERLFAEYGLTAEHIVEKAKLSMKR